MYDSRVHFFARVETPKEEETFLRREEPFSHPNGRHHDDDDCNFLPRRHRNNGGGGARCSCGDKEIELMFVGLMEKLVDSHVWLGSLLLLLFVMLPRPPPRTDERPLLLQWYLVMNKLERRRCRCRERFILALTIFSRYIEGRRGGRCSKSKFTDCRLTRQDHFSLLSSSSCVKFEV